MVVLFFDLSVLSLCVHLSASLPGDISQHPLCSPSRPPGLTAVIVQGGELGSLVAAASAVASPHAQLVPRGLTQLGQKHLPGAVGPQPLPGPGALGPVLQHDGCDRAAPVVPALQVKPSMCGVDVGEQVLVFAEGGLWGRGAQGESEVRDSEEEGSFICAGKESPGPVVLGSSGWQRRE